MHGHHETTGPHRHLWWLIAVLVLLAMFLIGVGSHARNPMREQESGLSCSFGLSGLSV